VEEVKKLEELLQAGTRGLLDLLRDERDRASIVAQLWEASQSRAAGKAFQKAAKKALYTLRSSGVDVDRYRPERERDGEENVDRLEVAEALLSEPDGFGNSQLVIALTDSAGSSLTLYRFVINALRGVLQFSRTGASRKAFHRAREEGAFFPVSAEYARFRLSKALEKTDRERISGLSALPPLLEGAGEPVVHPVREIPEARLSRIITPEEEKRIFSVPEVGGMMLPEEDVAETRKQIAEARASRLVLANKTPEERMQAILLRFYRTYFTPERLDDLSTRLLDVAAALHHRGARGITRLLVHYADSLRSPALVPEKHPLLNFLAYRAFMQPPEGMNR
jgi:hypothetical protein